MVVRGWISTRQRWAALENTSQERTRRWVSTGWASGFTMRVACFQPGLQARQEPEDVGVRSPGQLGERQCAARDAPHAPPSRSSRSSWATSSRWAAIFSGFAHGPGRADCGAHVRHGELVRVVDEGQGVVAESKPRSTCTRVGAATRPSAMIWALTVS